MNALTERIAEKYRTSEEYVAVLARLLFATSIADAALILRSGCDAAFDLVTVARTSERSLAPYRCMNWLLATDLLLLFFLSAMV
jgi:hypothetical protein